MDYEFHPAAAIFDLIEGDDFRELVEDIRAHGLINEIWLHPDGRILDGRNRYRACLEAGVEPRFKAWGGEGLAADFVWSLNGPRRHLDGNKRKLAAARYAIEREAEAKERQLSGLRNVGSLASIEANDALGKSAEHAAEKFNESRATVERAVKAEPGIVRRVLELKPLQSDALPMNTILRRRAVRLSALMMAQKNAFRMRTRLHLLQPKNSASRAKKFLKPLQSDALPMNTTRRRIAAKFRQEDGQRKPFPKRTVSSLPPKTSA